MEIKRAKLILSSTGKRDAMKLCKQWKSENIKVSDMPAKLLVERIHHQDGGPIPVTTIYGWLGGKRKHAKAATHIVKRQAQIRFNIFELAGQVLKSDHPQRKDIALRLLGYPL